MIAYEQHATSRIHFPDNGIIIPELQLPADDIPRAPQALLFRLHQLGNEVEMQCQFTYSNTEQSFGARIYLPHNVPSKIHLSFHQKDCALADAPEDNPPKIASCGLSAAEIVDGYFVLDTIKPQEADDSETLSYGQIVFHLGAEAVRAVVYPDKDGDPQPYELGSAQFAAVNVLHGLSLVLPAIELAGYDKLLAAANGGMPEDQEMRSMMSNIRWRGAKENWQVFGKHPVFRDLAHLVHEFVLEKTPLRKTLTAYHQYVRRNGLDVPFNASPELLEKLRAKRYDARRGAAPRWEKTDQSPMVYLSHEDIPRPNYLEITDTLRSLFPHDDQFVHHLLKDEPLLAALAGRLRTVEAVKQALEPRIGELIQKNTLHLHDLYALDIYTLYDLFGYRLTDTAYAQFRRKYATTLKTSVETFAQDLFYLPHAMLIADALEIDRQNMPIYTNNLAGLQHETVLRRAVEKMVAQLPEPYATVLVLRYLYKGTGLPFSEICTATGHTGWTWATNVWRGGILAIRSPEEIAPDVTRRDALLQTIGSGYRDIEQTLRQGEEMQRLIEEFRRHALLTLRSKAWSPHKSTVFRLVQTLNKEAGQLDDRVACDILKLPFTTDNLDIRDRVVTFNRFINKVTYRLAGAKTIGDLRQGNFDDKRPPVFSDGMNAARNMVKAHNPE
jgi:hypothetical protein